MKNEEAAAVLSVIVMGLDPKAPGAEQAREALIAGVEALKKQIPQNFVQKDLFVVCPHCKKPVLPTRHCPECGQALMGSYVESEEK